MLLKPDILGKSIDANVKKGEKIFYLEYLRLAAIASVT